MTALASLSHVNCTYPPDISTLELWEKGGIGYGEEAPELKRRREEYITCIRAGAKSEPDMELVDIFRPNWPFANPIV